MEHPRNVRLHHGELTDITAVIVTKQDRFSWCESWEDYESVIKPYEWFLSFEDIQIIYLLRYSKLTQRDVAKLLGISQPAVYIRHRNLEKHILLAEWKLSKIETVRNFLQSDTTKLYKNCAKLFFLLHYKGFSAEIIRQKTSFGFQTIINHLKKLHIKSRKHHPEIAEILDMLKLVNIQTERNHKRELSPQST